MIKCGNLIKIMNKMKSKQIRIKNIKKKTKEKIKLKYNKTNITKA